MDRAGRLAVLTGWVAGLAAVMGAMVALGHGALAGPDLHRPGSWASWAAARTAPEAAMGVFRLVVLGLAGYLLVATVVATAVRLVRAGRLVAVADVVTLPFVQSIVQAGLGLGLAGASLAVVGTAGPVPGGGPTADAALVAAVAQSAAPVLTPLPSDPAPSAPVPVSVPAPATVPAPPSTMAPATGPAGIRAVDPAWTVAPGEHLWSISARVLAGAWGRSPSDAEVTPYWRRLVSANRDRLADPGNADLLFPGQVITVPAPPPAP